MTDGRWRSVPTPGSSLPLDAQLLAKDPTTGARTLLVRFPPGFARPAPGGYDVDEDFLVLAGELSMNGHRFRAGHWVDVPAGTVRARTESAEGALAVAWFSGVPVWRSCDADAPGPALRQHRLGERPFRRRAAAGPPVAG